MHNHHGEKNPNYRHGLVDTRLYNVWANMKARCTGGGNSTSKKRYYERGIRLCEEWYTFKKFSEWALTNGYRDDLTIDRIDNDGNYEPSNCRFVTNKENCRNTKSHKITYALASSVYLDYSLIETDQRRLAFEYGISKGSVYNIIKNGPSYYR